MPLPVLPKFPAEETASISSQKSKLCCFKLSTVRQFTPVSNEDRSKGSTQKAYIRVLIFNKIPVEAIPIPYSIAGGAPGAGDIQGLQDATRLEMELERIWDACSTHSAIMPAPSPIFDHIDI